MLVFSAFANNLLWYLFVWLHPLPPPQATFFTAFLALDCRRIAARRNGICPLFVHAEKTEEEEEEEKKKSSGSKMTFGQRTFSHLANLVLSTPGKVIVLVTATALLGGGIYGTTQLRQVLHFYIFLHMLTLVEISCTFSYFHMSWRHVNVAHVHSCVIFDTGLPGVRRNLVPPPNFVFAPVVCCQRSTFSLYR